MTPDESPASGEITIPIEFRLDTPSPASLAARIARATAERNAAETELESLLEYCFVDFRPLFPRRRSFQFCAPANLEVWGVVESPAALAALVRAGFQRIRAHGHPQSLPLNCQCPVRGPTHPAIGQAS